MFAKHWKIVSMGMGLIVASTLVSPAQSAERKADPAADSQSDDALAAAHRQGALGVALNDKGNKLVVTAVQAASPALKAGLKAGDEISTVDGAKIKNAKEFIATIIKKLPGSQVELVIRRGGEQQTIKATLSSVDKLRGASQNRRIRDLENQLAQLKAQVDKMAGNRNSVPPVFQGNGDGGWYWDVEQGDDNQGLHDYGARARDGQ